MVEKLLEQVKNWNSTHFLGVVTMILLVIVGFDKIQAWRGGDPHADIEKKLDNIVATSEQNTLTAGLQTALFNFIACNWHAKEDPTERRACSVKLQADQDQIKIQMANLAAARLKEKQ